MPSLACNLDRWISKAAPACPSGRGLHLRPSTSCGLTSNPILLLNKSTLYCGTSWYCSLDAHFWSAHKPVWRALLRIEHVCTSSGLVFSLCWVQSPLQGFPLLLQTTKRHWVLQLCGFILPLGFHCLTCLCIARSLYCLPSILHLPQSGVSAPAWHHLLHVYLRKIFSVISVHIVTSCPVSVGPSSTPPLRGPWPISRHI